MLQYQSQNHDSSSKPICNPGTTATEAEASKIEKYCESLDNGYMFQLTVMEVQGSWGERCEIFITRLSEMLCRSHEDQPINELAAL